MVALFVYERSAWVCIATEYRCYLCSRSPFPLAARGLSRLMPLRGFQTRYTVHELFAVGPGLLRLVVTSIWRPLQTGDSFGPARGPQVSGLADAGRAARDPQGRRLYHGVKERLLDALRDSLPRLNHSPATNLATPTPGAIGESPTGLLTRA